MEDTLTMKLYVDPSEDMDDEELDRLTRQLRNEVQELQVESVELVPEEATPEHAKGDAVTLGALAIAVLPPLLPEVVKLLHAWLARHRNPTVRIRTQVAERSVEVEYSPNALSASELEKLVHTLTGTVAKEQPR